MRVTMILCAGHGTRLRPLTDWLAKPLVPVGDRPAVSHIADRVRAAGIERVVVNAHHRADDVRAWATAHEARLSLEEEELLGTAGGVAHAAAHLGAGDVLVWNGDILSDLDPRLLFDAHEGARAAATLAVAPRGGKGSGTVGLDRDGRVVRLRGVSVGDEASGADFLGIHVVGAGLRAQLPKRGCLVGDVYIPALRAGIALATLATTSSFTDIGSVAAYAAANRAWLGTRDAWVASDARVTASVGGSIVGAGAEIDADVADCVVWARTHVTAPLRNAIVTPFGTVALG